MRRILLLLALCGAAVCVDLFSICSSPEGSLSCGQCIKQHPECAWCRDPHSKASSRCQPRANFTADVCTPQYVYSPVTEMKISPHNLPLESKQGDRQTLVQMAPQQVVLRMKPGDTLLVPFTYIHKKPASGHEISDFAVQTSEFSSLGVDLKFLVECNGEEIESNKCPNMQEGQKINFKIKVTLEACKSSGDLAISVGVYGYQTVSAIFVSPLCGCECEKLQQQEKNSPLCYHHGNLICGQCECETGRGGGHCECPLVTYGVKTAAELEDKCREKPGAPVCGGHGSCRCGTCECFASTVTGQFCSCDHSSCPAGANGQQCSGNGACDCGQCKCEPGFSRHDCSCPTDESTCMEGGVMCSDNGHCECGKCVCNDGFTGAHCGSKDEIAAPVSKEEEEVKEAEQKKGDNVGEEGDKSGSDEKAEDSKENSEENHEMGSDNDGKREGEEEVPDDFLEGEEMNAEAEENSSKNSAMLKSLLVIPALFLLR